MAVAFPSAPDLVTTSVAKSVRMGSDGGAIAFTVTRFPANPAPNDEREAAVFVATWDDTGGADRITPWGRGADQPRWHPDSERLAFVMEDTDGEAQLYLRQPDADEPSALTAVEGGLDVGELAWSPAGDRIAFIGRAPDEGSPAEDGVPVINGGGDRVSRLWRIPGSGGEPEAVTADGVDVDAFTWGPDGDRLALVVTAGLEGQADRARLDPASLVTISAEGGDLQRLSDSARGFSSRSRTLDWSPDGSRILFTLQRRKASRSMPALIPAEGGEAQPLMADYPGHVMRARWRGDSDAIIAQAFRGLESRLLLIDPANGEVEELTRFNHRYPTFSASRDGDTVAYIGHEANAAANVWRYRAGGDDRRMTDLSPELRELTLGQVERVYWRNEAAGIELQGVLVTPPEGVAEPPYPLFVQPHGGPHTHWSLGWLGGWGNWAQWLAPRGYAVFQPNPRGSTGRGWDFAEAIRCCIGDPDGADVLAGVDALVARGIADPERLYIGGGSYAGFLTSWLLTKTDRFRAAVVWAGISDFVSFAGAAGLGAPWSEAFFPGSVQHRMAAYADRSPLRYLHRVQTPTLVMHGEEDPKIPPGQARQLYHGLQALGVESELAIYPRAGHGLSEYGQQLDALERIRDWIERH